MDRMEMQPHDMKEGMWVRLIGDRQRFGIFQGKVERAGRILARVQFPEGLGTGSKLSFPRKIEQTSRSYLQTVESMPQGYRYSQILAVP